MDSASCALQELKTLGAVGSGQMNPIYIEIFPVGGYIACRKIGKGLRRKLLHMNGAGHTWLPMGRSDHVIV